MSDTFNLGDLGYPTVETVRRAAAYHSILTDLIADLRERHRPTPSGYLCEACHERFDLWPCPEAQAADRAEARLREATGDE